MKNLIKKRLHKIVYKDSSHIAKYRYEIFYNKHEDNDLSRLSFKFNSDKGAPEGAEPKLEFNFHSMTDIYNLLLAGKKLSPINVFELGLGTNYTDTPSNMGINGSPGASLRMWKEYFPNAFIYGADIDKRILFQEDRIKTFYVDQTDPKSIRDLWSQIEVTFDLIVEDGLHEANANITFLENSFSKLNKNGLYVIEDIQNQNHAKTLIEYLNKAKMQYFVFKFDKAKNVLVTNYFIVILK